MSLTFGPRALTSRPVDADDVEVTVRGTDIPATLSTPVVITGSRNISFTVAAEGSYTISVNDRFGTSYKKNVYLQPDGLDLSAIGEIRTAIADLSVGGLGEGAVRGVKVETGDEERPAGAVLVFWRDVREDQTTAPTNMGSIDAWITGEVVVPDTTAPTVPTGLSSESITESGFTVTWEASTDAVGVTGYRVLLDGAEYATPTGTSQAVTGRAASTEYDVQVQARDAAGNWSDPSTVLPVTTATPGAAGLSVFGGAAPGTSQQIFTDGGGSLLVANAFYATQDISIIGVRIWEPAAATTEYLTPEPTVYAWGGDYTGGAVSVPTWASPTRTKVHTGSRTAGTWTDVMFDTPLPVSAINPASGETDCVFLGVHIDGSRYGISDVSSGTALQSVEATYLYLAEPGFPVGANNLGGSTTVHYLVDALIAGA